MQTKTIAMAVMFGLIGCAALILYQNRTSVRTAQFTREWTESYAPSAAKAPSSPETASKIVAGARSCVEAGMAYAPGYSQLQYPMGDIAGNKGVCTDVIVRALRNAGYDLQQLMHEDMVLNFQDYPNLWTLNEPDANIDHRRVPNQMSFLKKYSATLPVNTALNIENWQPGDMVFWRTSRGSLHCGIISDRLGERSAPLVIHNLDGAAEEDVLDRWRIIGHFRMVERNIGNLANVSTKGKTEDSQPKSVQ